jgi:hypothetical protein
VAVAVQDYCISKTLRIIISIFALQPSHSSKAPLRDAANLGKQYLSIYPLPSSKRALKRWLGRLGVISGRITRLTGQSWCPREPNSLPTLPLTGACTDWTS